MAYTPDTLALQVSGGIEGRVPQKWTYSSADADATITGVSYFADGYNKGMRVGDLVEAVNPTGPKFKLYQCSAVNATTGAATVAAPTAIV